MCKGREMMRMKYFIYPSVYLHTLITKHLGGKKNSVGKNYGGKKIGWEKNKNLPF